MDSGALGFQEPRVNHSLSLHPGSLRYKTRVCNLNIPRFSWSLGQHLDRERNGGDHPLSERSQTLRKPGAAGVWRSSHTSPHPPECAAS